MNLIFKVLVYVSFFLTVSTNQSFAKKKQKEIQYKEVIPTKKHNPDTTTINTYPQYPGGLEGFRDDLLEVVTINGKENLYNFSSMRITAEFIIDQNGHLHLLSSIPGHYPLSNEDHIFLRTVQKGFTQLKPWQPAIKNNAPIDFVLSIKILLKT